MELTLKHLHKLQSQPKAVRESIGGAKSFREAMAIANRSRYEVEQPSGKVINTIPDEELLRQINETLTDDEKHDVISVL